MENDSINIEIKNNYVDYPTFKKYKKLLFDKQKKKIAFCFIFALLIIAAYFLLQDDKKTSGIIYLIGAISCIFVYEYSCSKNIKQLILAQKEVYCVNELRYDLIFEDQSVKIKTQNTTGTLKYKDITTILKINSGLILFFGNNLFVYCQTNHIDSQTKGNLISLLKELPVKWIEKRI